MRPWTPVVLALAAASPLAAQPVAPRRLPGFDARLVDRSVSPCTDFYEFACGGWLKNNTIPPDRARWGRFDELRERNEETLKTILEEAAKPAAARDAATRKIGDLYASCMDEAAIEKKGAAPLGATLDRIGAIKGKADLARVLAALHLAGVDALFRFGAAPDYKDARRNIASLDQGGLGLPDRDYYLKDEARLADIRGRYPAHVGRMLSLLGESPEVASRASATVLSLETELARVSLDRVKRRDPANRYHKMTRAELGRRAPAFDWDAYFAALGAPAFTDLNVVWPDFFAGLSALLDSRPLEEWKVYLRWHAVHSSAVLLPARFVDEDFDFYGRVLSGTKELRPRWKRCVEYADEALGDALGRIYVERSFGPEAKERTAKMVEALEAALRRDITALDWMTEATKKRALEKLGAVAHKIGYPEKWRDYATVTIDRDDLLNNMARAAAFERARDLAKIGQAVDRTEWHMTPPTVNAYYNGLENNINFPAGILQPPFFDNTMDDAVNFGGIGAVIGHELTHGFDDQGRKFDPQGNMTDWWTEGDAREFVKRAACIADQYGQYTSGGAALNGQLTLGENVADNGGLRIASMALEDVLARQAAPPAPRDGFTPQQRLFLGWSQIWCQHMTEEDARRRVQVDPHSPGRYRVNGVVSNMPEFQKAFACPADAPMVRADACRVW